MSETATAECNIDKWSVKDFRELPLIAWGEDPGEFDSLIILPCTKSSGLHDSGFRYIDYVLVRDNKPFGRMGGCSDVLCLGGIGGFGKDWLEIYGKCPSAVPPSPWSIDCLPTSGLLRLFGPGKKSLSVDDALSSQCVYSKAPAKEEA